MFFTALANWRSQRNAEGGSLIFLMPRPVAIITRIGAANSVLTADEALFSGSILCAVYSTCRCRVPGTEPTEPAFFYCLEIPNKVP
jgi:hypothetical protein